MKTSRIGSPHLRAVEETELDCRVSGPGIDKALGSNWEAKGRHTDCVASPAHTDGEGLK